MKIIKQGIPPGEQPFKGTCVQCGTVIEFKRSEGKVTFDMRDGDFISIKCPICNYTISTSLRYGRID